MKEARLRSPRGTVRARGATAALAQAAAQAVAQLATDGARLAGPSTLAGAAAYAKGSPLRPSAARRHGLAAHLLRRPPPRLREAANLHWLHAHLFEAARPLAAAALWRGGLPRYQALWTELVPDSPCLEEWLPAADLAARGDVLAELARETGRLHALGFVHRDLFLRNILVRAAGPGRRLVFLDCWAGGPELQRRGPAYDLACLFLDGATQLRPDEQRDWYASYCAERARQERPVESAALARRVERARARLVDRLVREPGRRRGRPLQDRDWRLVV